MRGSRKALEEVAGRCADKTVEWIMQHDIGTTPAIKLQSDLKRVILRILLEK